MNWHAEINFAVTIAGGSIGGLCAGVALRGIGASMSANDPKRTFCGLNLLNGPRRAVGLNARRHR
jgi:hypothetical protein